jgi:hypothetical protein
LRPSKHILIGVTRFEEAKMPHSGDDTLAENASSKGAVGETVQSDNITITVAHHTNDSSHQSWGICQQIAMQIRCLC